MEVKFIPYELALIAYEKGFKIGNCGIGWYYKRRDTGEIHGLDTFYIDTSQNIQQWDALEEPVEAIIYQQIVDWFREKHNLIIFLAPFKDHAADVNSPLEWNYAIYGKSIGKGISTYYKALNKAIEEAFKLI